MTQLNGSTVLITGAARGLGRRLALGVVARGARVIAWDRDAEGLHALAQELGEGLDGSAVIDVTDRAAVLAQAARSGQVDVVINNAGVVSGERLEDLTELAVRRTFEVNVLALYWVTQAFLPQMLARDSGHVVTIASAAGLVGVARQTDYSASKHAARGFSESLRAELRQRGSKVSATTVSPFYIDTGMFAGVQTKVPWLLPILSEPRVADDVLRAIERNTAELFLPPLVRIVPVARFLPMAVFDRVCDLLGVNETMQHFTGRAGALAGDEVQSQRRPA
jgi:all-trans-retinol dehydrogenase (NAD+)